MLWLILLPLLSVGITDSVTLLGDFYIMWEKALKSSRIYCGFLKDYFIMLVTSLFGINNTLSSFMTG